MSKHRNAESLDSMLRYDRGNISFEDKNKTAKRIFNIRYSIFFYFIILVPDKDTPAYFQLSKVNQKLKINELTYKTKLNDSILELHNIENNDDLENQNLFHKRKNKILENLFEKSPNFKSDLIKDLSFKIPRLSYKLKSKYFFFNYFKDSVSINCETKIQTLNESIIKENYTSKALLDCDHKKK